MLLTAAKQAPNGERWIHEIKYDGYRMLCHVSEGIPTFISRHGRSWTSSLPGLVGSIQKLNLKDTILDGELVYFVEDGRTDFDELGRVIRRKSESLSYVAFDLVRHEGRDLTRIPLIERKQILGSILKNAPSSVRLSEHLYEDGKIVYEQACRLGLEGIVSKKADSLYLPGKRSKHWLKIKNCFEEDFLICGLVESKGEVEALHVGQMRNGILTYSGKVELGLWNGVLEEIRKRVKKSKECPFGWSRNRKFYARWVEPEMEIRVRFTAWSSKGRIREGRLHLDSLTQSHVNTIEDGSSPAHQR